MALKSAKSENAFVKAMAQAIASETLNSPDITAEEWREKYQNAITGFNRICSNRMKRRFDTVSSLNCGLFTLVNCEKKEKEPNREFSVRFPVGNKHAIYVGWKSKPVSDGAGADGAGADGADGADGAVSNTPTMTTEEIADQIISLVGKLPTRKDQEQALIRAFKKHGETNNGFLASTRRAFERALRAAKGRTVK